MFILRFNLDTMSLMAPALLSESLVDDSIDHLLENINPHLAMGKTPAGRCYLDGRSEIGLTQPSPITR